MPDQNQTAQTNPSTSKSMPAMPLAKTPSPEEPEEVDAPEDSEKITRESGPIKLPPISAVEEQIIGKIDEFHNILIALSSDPSVDEIAAAIGLTLHLDRMGKRATAIYSGHTPNALEFLRPDETFETSADALQDFVIALNKEKADHLRYKLDGEYVKIYITPYKARIAEDDLDFSYGDYNVDLVLALGVANGIDLDDALREHGRIMHDASIINITTGNPGKFGEIEWSNKASSSVSEMIATLLYNMDSDVRIDPDEATAFLTGITAATDRFSKANTSAITMEVASRLMDSGAKHQLISKNITADLDNKLYDSPTQRPVRPQEEPENDDSINVSHASNEPEPSDDKTDEPSEDASSTKDTADSSLLDELKDAEANLTIASAETTPDAKAEPVSLDKIDETPTPATPSAAPSFIAQSEKIIAPPTDFTSSDLDSSTNKYGKMLEDALAETKVPAAPIPSPEPAIPNIPNPTMTPSPMPSVNPAASIAPPVASAPEINGVPEINYSPVANTAPTDSQVLPPPPVPPINMNSPLPEPPVSMGSPLPEPPMMASPAPSIPAPSAPTTPLPTPPTPPAPSAPDAFRIPGM